MRRYQNTRSALFAGWTPDGQITISTRFGNTNQLHLVGSRWARAARSRSSTSR